MDNNYETNPGVFLMVGLGNPGREYHDNRHNAGFMAIDRISERFNIKLSRMQCQALVGTGTAGSVKLILAKPQTFMNLSGQAVGGLVRFYKTPLNQLLVINDDMDLPFGEIRLRPGGGSAGQKGMGSIIERLGTQTFPRMRIGIGHPGGRRDTADYVLGDFTNAEQDVLNQVMTEAADAAVDFLEKGLEYAMTHHNRQPINGKQEDQKNDG
jgi:PTH1 family peptidyl-tRNA hydrolase